MSHENKNKLRQPKGALKNFLWLNGLKAFFHVTIKNNHKIRFSLMLIIGISVGMFIGTVTIGALVIIGAK